MLSDKRLGGGLKQSLIVTISQLVDAMLRPRIRNTEDRWG